MLPGFCLCAPRPAVDGPPQIDRTIRKEPVYQSGGPGYCLLVFGPKAETRVWLVLDLLSELTDPKGEKDVLYVDRDGDGDLTAPAKRVPVKMQIQKSSGPRTFLGDVPPAPPREVIRYLPRFEVGAVVEKDGKTRHSDLLVEVGEYLGRHRTISISLKIHGGWMQYADDMLLAFARDPQDAPIIHFNGPLTVRLSPAPASWVPPRPDLRTTEGFGIPLDAIARGKATDLRVQLGTPGQGEGTFASVSCNALPETVHPVAELTFPSKTPGGPPIKVRKRLEDRC
jgi:hypothetical protein